MPASRLRQLLKFIRVFGVTDGTRLWINLLLQTASSTELLELSVPGLTAPIHLRRRDLPIFWQILVRQENDFQSLPQAGRMKEIYRRTLSDGEKPLIVDCGGHIGLSTVWFASRFPEAVIYCIEPDTSNFKLLQRNTSPYPNVTPLPGGIWNRACNLEIANPNSGSASFQLREVDGLLESEQPNLLRAYTIEEIIRKDEGNHLFLVKIDIEGAESVVFQDHAEWLKAARVLIIELHDWLLPGQGTSKNFFKRLGENDFDVVIRGENLLLFQI
jgi:FkbM family methyltransferase